MFHRDGELDASGLVGADEILDDAGNEIGIGDHDGRAIEGLDLGRADVDAADDALVGADRNPVADADSAFPEEDQPGNEILTIDCRPKPIPTESAPATMAILAKSTPR